MHCLVDILIADNYYKRLWLSQQTNVTFGTQNRSIASRN